MNIWLRRAKAKRAEYVFNWDNKMCDVRLEPFHFGGVSIYANNINYWNLVDNLKTRTAYSFTFTLDTYVNYALQDTREIEVIHSYHYTCSNTNYASMAVQSIWLTVTTPYYIIPTN